VNTAYPPGTVIRVAFDATLLVGQRTGIGVLVSGVLGELALRDDIALQAFAMTWRGRDQVRLQLPPGVGIGRVPMAARLLQEVWGRVDGPAIEWWTGPVDVVHGTNYVVPPARHAAEVVSVHDLAFSHFPEMCEPTTLRYPGLIRRALRRGAMVHALSDSMAAEIVDLFALPPDRVRVVAPGLDRMIEQHSPAGPPYILALGKVEPRKNLPLLVQSFDAVAGLHPEVELVIAGPPGWAEDDLTAEIGVAVHRRRIRRIGWVSDAERAALLGGARVFAYPSLYEGFGLPPLEAMSVGVPVVASAAGALPEVIGGAARLVPAGDADAFAGALLDVLQDDDERARLIAAGRLRAAQFSWKRCADGLSQLYVDAAAAHG
jgi:glycosyltransferase involved in cell wall biosynthesis